MKQFCFLSVLFVFVAIPFFGQDFTITKLPSLATVLSSSGQVAGGGELAYVWSRTRGIQYLGDLGLANSTEPRAINKVGEVVGESTLADGVTYHAFLWTSQGGMKDLGSPLGGDSQATAINDAGEIAGWSASPDGSNIHAFFWSSGTGIVDLGIPPDGDPQSYAAGINDIGEVIGTNGIPSYGFPGRCFRWTETSGMTQSGNTPSTSLSGCSPQQRGINHSGQIIGSDFQAHAAIWQRDGSVLDLGTLSGDLASAALSLNRAGHVTGYSRPKANIGLQRSFFWTPTGGLIDIGRLPKYPNVRSIPAGINSRDQVVGENGAAYFWSKATGIVQVTGANYPVYGSLNDAGQFLGTQPAPALASPIMHVTLTASQSSSTLGQSVTFTVKVKAIVGLPPNGEQVTFLDGKSVLGTGALKNGVATLTTSTLKVGTNNITATYPGDNNYYPNKSAVLAQVVSP
jgi:probable HAF family extracellular repeat protein